MSSLTSISASRIEQLPGRIRKLVDVRNGQKHATERRFFPATCWPKWSSPTEAYHLIKNTPKVTGFLGFHKKPIPISDAEAAYILHQIQEGIERPKAYRCFAT
jgi:transcription termination/antitermination protein NusG